MASTTFTLRLDPETKEALEAEARIRDRSAAWLAKQAITEMLDREAYMREQVRLAMEQADRGELVDGETVLAWLDRWADGHDEPCPVPGEKGGGHGH